jgi:hypothetical protein
LIIFESTEHNHPASDVKSEVRLFQDNIRSRVIDTTERTQCVVGHYFNNVSDPMVACLSNFKHVKKNGSATTAK